MAYSIKNSNFVIQQSKLSSFILQIYTAENKYKIIKIANIFKNKKIISFIKKI